MHDWNEDVGGQLLVIGCEADTDRDQSEQQQLPPTAQPERTAMGELDEIVKESDRSTAERDEEDGERRNLVLREGEKRTSGDDEDQQAAHRRCSLLHTVACR